MRTDSGEAGRSVWRRWLGVKSRLSGARLRQGVRGLGFACSAMAWAVVVWIWPGLHLGNDDSSRSAQPAVLIAAASIEAAVVVSSPHVSRRDVTHGKRIQPSDCEADTGMQPATTKVSPSGRILLYKRQPATMRQRGFRSGSAEETNLRTATPGPTRACRTGESGLTRRPARACAQALASRG